MLTTGSALHNANIRILHTTCAHKRCPRLVYPRSPSSSDSNELGCQVTWIHGLNLDAYLSPLFFESKSFVKKLAGDKLFKVQKIRCNMGTALAKPKWIHTTTQQKWCINQQKQHPFHSSSAYINKSNANRQRHMRAYTVLYCFFCIYIYIYDYIIMKKYT